MLVDASLWNTSATRAPGTLRWQAPELINAEQRLVTMKSDIYAFGLTCYVCLMSFYSTLRFRLIGYLILAIDYRQATIR